MEGPIVRLTDREGGAAKVGAATAAAAEKRAKAPRQLLRRGKNQK